jgi:hypothetical protein
LGLTRARRGAIHVGVLLAVVVQLGFAAAFFADAANTSHIQDALNAHRVSVTAKTAGCFMVYTGRFNNGTQVCHVSYRYRGESFGAVIPYNQSRTFYVDPLDPALHMNKLVYDSGSTEQTGDVIFGALLLFGAALVTAVHQLHMHRRRKRRLARR